MRDMRVVVAQRPERSSKPLFAAARVAWLFVFAPRWLRAPCSVATVSETLKGCSCRSVDATNPGYYLLDSFLMTLHL